MAFDKELFDDICREFTVDGEELHTIAADFRYDLKQGLKDPELSSLRMLKSYVGLPTGEEKGEYLALDFGGTNVRVLRIRLDGHGKFEVLKKVAKPLRVEGIYDYVGEGSTAEQMFDFIAELVDEAIDGDHTKKYLLGHTFSFPSEQTNLYDAKLIIWTKEFATAGVEGKVVNDLLKEALHRQSIDNVEPTAVINDTVAIGSIYATGHNTCYLEPFADKAERPMILNLESGGFMKLVPNRFDVAFDEHSEKPGEQRLEKMVSGRYMGELFGMALAELLGEKGKAYGFTSIDMSNIVLDESPDKAEVQKIVDDATVVIAVRSAAGVVAETETTLVEAEKRVATLVDPDLQARVVVAELGEDSEGRSIAPAIIIATLLVVIGVAPVIVDLEPAAHDHLLVDLFGTSLTHSVILSVVG